MNLIPSASLRDFLALSYHELEEKNLEMKALRNQGKDDEFFRRKITSYLKSETRVKAVTIAFCDLEGRLHMLDYDKKFFLEAYDNLTFDGSSIRGFSAQKESDLRFKVDWGAVRWLPADIFGPGKILIFAFVCNQDGSQYSGDFRGQLKALTNELRQKKNYTVLASAEIEGFLLEGVDAEQNYHSSVGFSVVTRGGYFSALPQDRLRQFIDAVAEAQRAMGYENEKDHGEVAPAQFEINFKYSEVLTTCDQILLYKLVCRQVAKLMNCTATFLPKPVIGINGSGMHTNISISKNGKNIFYEAKGKNSLSETAYRFINGILFYANDICLIINPSVNAYRRLDPHFEAPNEIMYSPSDRGAMVRIPIGNEKSARIEVRSVAPDVNPYLALYALIQAGLTAVESDRTELQTMEKVVEKKPSRMLWGNISDATEAFRSSRFMKDIMQPLNHQKYLDLKAHAADRSPKDLGTKVKTAEIIYHHEVTNQMLWNSF